MENPVNQPITMNREMITVGTAKSAVERRSEAGERVAARVAYVPRHELGPADDVLGCHPRRRICRLFHIGEDRRNQGTKRLSPEGLLL